jgi:glycoprotein endo-alpha-1,2-mannosidase
MMARRLAACLGLCLGMVSGAHAADIPKQVLAFYYGWYGTPDVSGHWSHWRDVDTQHHRAASSTQFPAKGAYDSRDPKVIAQQIQEAKDAGVTGFITDWWERDDIVDRGLPALLSAAHQGDISVTAMFDRAPEKALDKAKTIASDMAYILMRYGNDPAWLKVNGKPVLFIYAAAIEQIKTDDWARVVKQVRDDVPGGEVLIPDTVNKQIISLFDGSCIYTMAMHTHDMQPDAIRHWAQEWFPNLVKLPGPGKVTSVTVMPGFDNRKGQRITQRWDGQTYRALWLEAVKADPDYVLISTWNEWHEGSEIEPSVQFGDRYLKQTAEYARQFLAQRHQ